MSTLNLFTISFNTIMEEKTTLHFTDCCFFHLQHGTEQLWALLHALVQRQLSTPFSHTAGVEDNT